MEEYLDMALDQVALDFNNCEHSETYCRYVASLLLREKGIIKDLDLSSKAVTDAVYKFYNKAREEYKVKTNGNGLPEFSHPLKWGDNYKDKTSKMPIDERRISCSCGERFERYDIASYHMLNTKDGKTHALMYGPDVIVYDHRTATKEEYDEYMKLNGTVP